MEGIFGTKISAPCIIARQDSGKQRLYVAVLIVIPSLSLATTEPALNDKRFVLEAHCLGITDFVIGLLMRGKRFLNADGSAEL